MIETQIRTLVGESGGEVALYYEDLASSDALLIEPDLRMHAASTMKVPVMIQLFLDRDHGLLSLDDSLPTIRQRQFYGIQRASRFLVCANRGFDEGRVS